MLCYVGGTPLAFCLGADKNRTLFQPRYRLKLVISDAHEI